MKNKSVHSCHSVHHAKFHCIMTTLNKLFKIEFERGDWKRANGALEAAAACSNLEEKLSKRFRARGTKTTKINRRTIVGKTKKIRFAKKKLRPTDPEHKLLPSHAGLLPLHQIRWLIT